MKNASFILFLISLFSCSPKAGKEMLVGQIITPKGEILFRFHEKTPRHKESFRKLAEAHYWDSLSFNRVIPNFVAQGGCPDTKEGFAGSPYLLEPEFDDSLRHVYGAVGAGRDDNPEMKSAGCQFYIVQNKNGLHRLDKEYTVFGQVMKGMDIIDALVNVPRDSNDAPVTPVMIKVRVMRIRN
jgi:peptidyl-prolyl cis-trans isomerase B (cyclophilin B)